MNPSASLAPGRVARLRPSRPGQRLNGLSASGILAALLTLTLFLAPGAPALAATPRLDAEKVMHVKGAFLYSFSKFIIWPNEATAERFVLCVSDQPRLAEILASSTRQRQVKGRDVAIVPLSGDADPSACHMLYLAGRTGESLRTALDGVRELPILTVGESEDFLQRGGMIRFFIENERLRFEIDNRAARRVDIEISSELLGLGRTR